MKPLSIVLLIAEAAAASALAAAVTAFAIRQGAGPWIIYPALALVFVVVAGVLLWMGIQVRRFRAHKATWVDAVSAFRIAMFARASALGGVISAGLLAGMSLAFLARWEAQTSVYAGICGLMCALGAGLWGIAGVVVERWCVIDPKDDDTEVTKARARRDKGTLGAQRVSARKSDVSEGRR